MVASQLTGRASLVTKLLQSLANSTIDWFFFKFKQENACVETVRTRLLEHFAITWDFFWCKKTTIYLAQGISSRASISTSPFYDMMSVRLVEFFARLVKYKVTNLSSTEKEK